MIVSNSELSILELLNSTERDCHDFVTVIHSNVGMFCVDSMAAAGGEGMWASRGITRPLGQYCAPTGRMRVAEGHAERSNGIQQAAGHELHDFP
jgi:hypothetical protein